jgi:hypothetical protein
VWLSRIFGRFFQCVWTAHPQLNLMGLCGHAVKILTGNWGIMIRAIETSIQRFYARLR